MRHRRSNTSFGRTANQRKALFRGLMASVLEHERIETTVAKAKEVKRLTEKMITLGKRGDLNSRRVAFANVPNKNVIKKLFDEIAPRFADRNGGYMRIIKTRSRIKDNAPLAVLEFIDYEETNMREGKEGSAKKETPVKKKAAPKKAETQEESMAKKKTAKKKVTKKATAEKDAKPEKKTVSKKKTTVKKKAATKKKTDK